MAKKRKRLWMRLVILIIMMAAVGYTLYSGIFSDRQVISAGDQVPDFQLITLDGETTRLSDYKGQGVFLNFWATYCPPRKEEMPRNLKKKALRFLP